MAVGAASELRTRASDDSRLEQLAATSYIRALQATQTDLEEPLSGLVPSLFACLLLATADLLFERYLNALTHLRGAFKMLAQRRLSNSPYSGLSLQENTLNADTPPAFDDKLELLFQALDVQTSTYALSYQPELLSPPRDYNDPSNSYLKFSRVSLLQILQPLYRWTARMHNLKDSPVDFIEQGRHIAKLSTWLEVFNSTIKPLQANTVNPTKESLIILEHVLILRMTCLSALIYVSTNLRSYETSFDIHASRFQQIVVNAEKVLWIRSIKDKLTKRTSNHPQFSRGPGIIQPLFLTAEKYRDSHWRRRAIACLSEAGLEGPFNGPREAAIALRVLQHEEAWPDNPPPVLKVIGRRLNLRNIVLENEGPACKVSTDISEAARLNGCRMPPIESSTLRAVHRFKEQFYRYRDVPNLPLCSQDDAGSASLFEDTRGKGWEIWEEFIEYPSLVV